MPKRLLFATCLLSTLALPAQRTGSWRDHFAYTQGVELMPMPNQLVCATYAGLLFFDGELAKLSKVNGLSDFGITAAMYDASRQRIVLGYDNGNIDVLNSLDASVLSSGTKTLNIEEWKSSRKPGAKRINRFLRIGGKYLVATASRILEISDNEITADFTINDTGDTLAVRDLALFGNSIVAATAKGLYAVDKDEAQLYSYSKWSRALSDSSIVSLAVNGNTIYALQGNGTLFSSQDLQAFSTEGSFPNPRALSVAGGELWLSTSTKLYNISAPQKSISSYGSSLSTFSPYRIGLYKSTIYVADLAVGLVGELDAAFTQLIPNGPQQNEATALAEQKGKIAAAGSSALSLLDYRGTWVSAENFQITNAQAVKIGRQNATEVFVSTSSGVAQFSQANAAINFVEKSLSGSDIRSLNFDRNGNLFGLAYNGDRPVNRRSTSGLWTSVANADLQGKQLGKATYTGRTFWGICGANQLYAYASGKEVDDPSNDQAVIFSLTPFSDGINAIYSIAADRDGDVWLGTNAGVLLYTSTADPFTSTPANQRVKIPNEMPGRASYLLEYERVTAIAVDGGNRKWFGTRDAGVFLQTPDGANEIHAFSVLNSPLPSNKVVDIAVNSLTGEVIFATDKGMVGFFGEATAGASDFAGVKVFPNPVRPEMELVTITNLMEDAFVRITDMSGNLVFMGTASGGAITWNVRNLNGHRVTAGVYLAFVADGQGQASKVVKLLVMN